MKTIIMLETAKDIVDARPLETEGNTGRFQLPIGTEAEVFSNGEVFVHAPKNNVEARRSIKASDLVLAMAKALRLNVNLLD